MDQFLFIYLVGAAFGFIAALVKVLTSHVVKVSNITGILLNTLLSWGCVLIFIFNLINDFLNWIGWNKVIWTSKAFKQMQKDIEKTQRKSHINPLRRIK